MASRPVPTPHPDSAPYWEGCAAGELRLQHCGSCGQARFYPRARCPFCFAPEAEWRAVSGRGTVHSYTVVHRAFHPWFAERIPYVVALVDLDEGPRMMTNIVTDHSAVAIGRRVRVLFERHGDSTLPLFEIVPDEE